MICTTAPAAYPRVCIRSEIVGQFELLLSPSALREENFLIRDTISQKFKLTHSPLRKEFAEANSTSRAGSPLLFGLAPRGVFRASFVAKRAVGSYPTFSPLPANQRFEGVLQVSLRDATVLEFTGGLILCGTFREPQLSPRLP